jgi:hypothetical protein
MDEIIDEAPDYDESTEVVEKSPRTWDDVISENSAKFHKWKQYWDLTLSNKYGMPSVWRFCNMIYGFSIIKFDEAWEQKYPYMDDENCGLEDAIRRHCGEDADGIMKMLYDLSDLAEEPPKDP